MIHTKMLSRRILHLAYPSAYSYSHTRLWLTTPTTRLLCRFLSTTPKVKPVDQSDNQQSREHKDVEVEETVPESSQRKYSEADYSHEEELWEHQHHHRDAGAVNGDITNQ